MKRVFTILVTMFALIACGGPSQLPDVPNVAQTGTPQIAGVPPLPTPGLAIIGQDGTYLNYGVYQPLDVYTLTGVVLAAPQAVVQAHIDGSSYSVDGYGSGYISGGTSGKGIVRFHVTGMNVSNAYVEQGLVRRDESWKPLAVIGDDLIIKVEDTRGMGFAAGDTLTLICREQWEIVGAVGIGEIPFLRNISREFDLCRMADGHIIPAPTKVIQ